MKARLDTSRVKEVRRLLVVCAVFQLLFAPLLVKLIYVVPLLPRTMENLVFVMLATSILLLLFLLSAGNFILLALHARAINVEGNTLVIERFLAPRVCMDNERHFNTREIPVPSLAAPGYRAGTLFIAGSSSFYLPADFPNREILTAVRLASKERN